MFSPPHMHQASVDAQTLAEPQYWKDNLPLGHGR